MDIEELPDPGEIWWPFAVLAALDRSHGRRAWSLDAGNHVLSHDGPDGGQIRMQRLHGNRMVLWGRAAGEQPHPSSWSGIPGWATSDAVAHWLRREGATLLAWHHHGEWDGATPHADAGAVLAPLLEADVPQVLLRRARAGKARLTDLRQVLGDDGDAERGLAVLRRAAVEAPPVQGGVRTLLTHEIHAQMRRTRDRDRLLPQRPVAVVRWARVAGVPENFGFTVRAERGKLIADPESDALPEQFRTQLLNVLAELHREEATEQGGAWLFARVRCTAGRVSFDRAYDGMPDWYRDTPIPLEALDWEMAQREPDWRPAWASLLPDPGR